MNTVKERVLVFINNRNISTAEFERIIGVSGGYVKNISKSIQPEILERISNIYPSLNLEWLLIGKGDMLKKEILETPMSNTVHRNVKGGIIGGIGNVGGNVNGNGNNVGIIPADCEKKLIRAQVEIDYLKKENKTLKDQLKQAMTDKDKAMSMLDKALNK